MNYENRVEVLKKQFETMEKAFEEYKKKVYSNYPWYKKLWIKLTKRGL